MSGHSGAASPSPRELQIVVYRPNPDRRFTLVHDVPALQSFEPLAAQQTSGGSSIEDAGGAQGGAAIGLQPDTERDNGSTGDNYDMITGDGAQSGLRPAPGSGLRPDRGSRLRTEAARRRFYVGQNSRDRILADQRGAAATNLYQRRMQQRPGAPMMLTLRRIRE